MSDAGFHLDLESNNADCGDLIDLMKPEREPSTILFFWQSDLSRTGFEGLPLCLANIDFDMPWLRGAFLFPRQGKRLGKTVGKNLGEKLRGTSCEKNFDVLAA